jgi:hypothetical protein
MGKKEDFMVKQRNVSSAGKGEVLRDVTSCRLVRIYRRFEEVYWFHVQVEHCLNMYRPKESNSQRNPNL